MALFELLRPGPVRLEVFDVGGRSVAEASLGAFGSGLHRIPWGAAFARPASGVYFLRLMQDGQVSDPVRVLAIR